MTARETAIALRAEFVDELEALERDLAAAQAESARAEAAYEADLTAWRELQKFVQRGVVVRVAEDGMAGPLWARLQRERDERLRESSGRRGAARALIRSITERIAERRLSIAQLDDALAADTVVALPAQESPRRKPQLPVEFDNIVMPREGAQ